MHHHSDHELLQHDERKLQLAPQRRALTVGAFGTSVRFQGPSEVVRAIRQQISAELYEGTSGPATIDLTIRYRRGWPGRTAHFLLTSSRSGLAATEATPDAMAEVAISEATAFLAEHASPAVFIHAGVVTISGRALLLPGSTKVGKSTLVASLVQQGATYYSDEFAVISPAGLVEPFARPISLRTGGLRQRTLRTAEDLGGSSGTEPATVAAVIFAKFDAAAEAWQPRRLTAGEGVLGLTQHALAARTAPDRVLQAASAVARSAILLEGPRPDAEVAAHQIRDHFLRLIEA